jgi:hypothetical protein
MISFDYQSMDYFERCPLCKSKVVPYWVEFGECHLSDCHTCNISLIISPAFCYGQIKRHKLLRIRFNIGKNMYMFWDSKSLCIKSIVEMSITNLSYASLEETAVLAQKYNMLC